MNSFFDLENPLWSFLGKLTDVFILSLLWFICSIPIITIGASTSALYYCTLKLSVDKEGYTVKSFFGAFRNNFKQGTIAWIILLFVGGLLYFDLMWSFQTGGTIGKSMLLVFGVTLLLYFMVSSYVFPLIVRCESKLKNIFIWAFVMSIRNIHISIVLVSLTIGLFFIGFFVFWPIFFIGMGFLAFIQAYFINLVFKKYKLELS